jgi:hypothetical protein
MKLEELRERLQTTHGPLPQPSPLAEGEGRRYPLGAFSILGGGDAFELVNGRPPPEGPARARAYVEAKVAITLHGATAGHAAYVRDELVRQIQGSVELIARLQAAKPIAVELIPPGRPMSAYGYPRAVPPNAQGLFWDQQEWKTARIALRQECLSEPALVTHEMAHAIHYLAFTEEERALIYRTMLPTYRSRVAVDEVFAIYSEREFLPVFGEREKRAPGVYGMARNRWSEEHVFTRFVRNLYFPYRPLAGPPSRLPVF